jgi:hypothetical protein
MHHGSHYSVKSPYQLMATISHWLVLDLPVAYVVSMCQGQGEDPRKPLTGDLSRARYVSGRNSPSA